MTDQPTPQAAAAGVQTVVCDQCRHEVPALEYCVRCGDPLAAEKQRAQIGRRGQFAANPGERALAVHLVSTLFPQLPRADMDTFRAALLIGIAVVVGLCIFGLYPLALVAAELIVPMVMVLYVWDVDVYEDEPFHVLALTAGWGIFAGVVIGLAVRYLLPSDAGSVFGEDAATIVTRGVVLPLVGGLLMLIGPLILLPYRKFNDVLDGATFGAVSALAYTAALGLVGAIDLFSGGLRPTGEVMPWITRLLALGVATPIIAASVIGATAGAFWLRYRGPAGDRGRLGLLGKPAVAVVVGAIILVVASVGQLLLTFLPALIWLGFLAVLTLLWLRAVIHIGLLQEAAEIPIGPPVVCANCGRLTPAHCFCGYCGTSLRAQPKHRGTAAPQPTGSSTGSRP